MDFFAQQEAARRKSARLSWLAVLFVPPVVYLTSRIFKLALWGVWAVCDCDPLMSPLNVPDPAAWIRHLAVSGWIGFRRTASGPRIMKLVGARKARRDAEGQFVNIAEEMAVASGAAVPSLWVLDDGRGINAFAAGYGMDDAAICVTSGALERLTRDELQGVVAHEFGHILNGDMRLNTRLSATVQALGGVAALGRTMLRPFGNLFETKDDGGGCVWLPRGGGGKGGGGPLLLIVLYVLVGAALWLVGLAGEAFARLLQSAVSREREFLADAAATQFTRNPEGLADALRLSLMLPKCFGSAGTSSMTNVAHMFFLSEDLSVARTHPPVEDRIRRLSPHGVWDGRQERFRERLERFRAEREARIRANRAKYEAQKALKAQLTPKGELVVPRDLTLRLRTADGAGETLLALLRGERVPGWIGGMTAAMKRQLAAKAVAAIRQWGSAADVAAWARRIREATEQGLEMGSFEFMVSCTARRQLGGQKTPQSRLAWHLVPQATAVVATVASFGNNAEAAYALAGGRLKPYFRAWPAYTAPLTSVRLFREALEALQTLMPLVKREFLWALRDVISQDGVVTDDEANYLAAVAEAICAYGWKQ